MTEHDLTERELRIAREAARIVVQELTDTFYKQIGQGVVKRVLVVIGLAIVGWLATHGFFKWP